MSAMKDSLVAQVGLLLAEAGMPNTDEAFEWGMDQIMGAGPESGDLETKR